MTMTIAYNNIINNKSICQWVKIILSVVQWVLWMNHWPSSILINVWFEETKEQDPKQQLDLELIIKRETSIAEILMMVH